MRSGAAHRSDVGEMLEEIRTQAAGCTACELYKTATRTVFGEGPSDASVMLVGEQPGDQKDRAGHPFVGPAGRVLDQALPVPRSIGQPSTSPTR